MSSPRSVCAYHVKEIAQATEKKPGKKEGGKEDAKSPAQKNRSAPRNGLLKKSVSHWGVGTSLRGVKGERPRRKGGECGN